MNQMAERELYFTQKLKNTAFNIRYKLLAYLQQYQGQHYLKGGDQLHILGRSFYAKEQNVKQIANQIYQIFMNTPWFTYRSGFPQLATEPEESYVSDTGWGCMVRVGQMLFAEIIKEHRKQNKDSKQILKLFNDFDRKASLSIQNISKLALKFYNLKPGEWYNPSQISNILTSLYEKQCAQSQNLNFLVFNSGNIFFDQIVEKMFGQKISVKKRCKCPDAQNDLLCKNCYQKMSHSSIAVIVLSRIGIEKPQPKYLQALEQLMTFKQFRGVIGGKPKKALYFLGRHNTDYIYLDPHYVQQAKQQIETIQNSYICESFRKCRNSAIDSSLGICFYIQSIDSLNDFHRQIKQMKQKNAENMFIFTSDTTPSYIKKQATEDFQLDSDDQKFVALT